MASPAAAEAGWFVLDAQSQPVGPYDAAAMIDMAAAGHISSEALVWREGRSSWDKLAEVPVLQAGSTPRAAAAAEPATTRPAQVAADTDPSDPLEAFQAEISAIEAAEEAAAAGAAAEEGAADAPGTPEELEFEDDDGTMYVWDATLRKYVPAGRQNGEASTSEPGTAQQQQQQQQRQQRQQQFEYDMEAMTFVDTPEVVPTLAAAKAAVAAAELEAAMDPEQLAREERKRKADAAIADHKEKLAKRKEADAESAAKQAAWFELKKNTSVYVTGLPLDVTEEEVEQEFSKCGIIKEGPDGKPRIKLYRDKETGQLKGDGLVTFLKEPSVELALQLLDGAHFRATGPPMTVTNAKFEMKGDKYVPKAKGGPKGGKGSKKQQLEKLEKKLGWGGFDDKQPPEKVTVVLQHMFAPEEFVDQPGLVQELEADILAECSKQGPIDKVKVYSTNPAGVATVRFKMIEDAEKCISVMQGRWFGGRQVKAHMWDGRTNYHIKVQETPEQEAARLEAFARELEAQQEKQQQQQQQEQESEQRQEQQQHGGEQDQQPVLESAWS